MNMRRFKRGLIFWPEILTAHERPSEVTSPGNNIKPRTASALKRSLHSNSNCQPTSDKRMSARDAFAVRALLRLDLMAAIDVDGRTGLPGVVRAAHLLPTTAAEIDDAAHTEAYGFLEPTIPAHLDVDFLELINSLEAEMARNRRAVRRA